MTTELRVRLQQRLTRVLVAPSDTIEIDIAGLVRLTDSSSVLRGILEEAHLKCSDFDPGAWIEERFSRSEYAIPTDDARQLVLYDHILRVIVAEDVSVTWLWGINFFGERDQEAGIARFGEHFVKPLVRLLEDGIGDVDYVSGLLRRYQQRVEWFTRKRLIAEARADPGHSEAILDADVRLYLFDQGVEFAFSQPNSPSGEADIVVGVDAEPIPFEVKLHDTSRGYRTDRVRSGVRQAFDYARDHNRSIGYLMVFNFDERPLQFPDDGDGAGHPELHVGNVRVVLVGIELVSPEDSASSRPPLDPIELSRDDLIPVPDA